MPGQGEGTVVLAGHMDGLRRSGAMSAVLDVAAGDVVTVRDHLGTAHEYRAVSRATVPRDALDAGLFATDGPHRLVLITCGGEFDRAPGQYAENLVVVAEPAG